MDEFARRDVDYYAKISESSSALRNLLTHEMEKLTSRVMDKIYEFDNILLTTGFRSDRIERMHTAIKTDVSRHEVLCFEIATKFETQNTIFKEIGLAVEGLKTYALVTDLHLEAYLPLQAANIAYEVGKLTVRKDK